MKVEELKSYGAKLQMPKKAIKEQTGIMFRAVLQRFGLWGMIEIGKDSLIMQRKLKN